jgi:peptidoglycan hydrolase FlgJ
MDTAAITAGLASDPKALGSLRARAAKDPEGTLQEAARQFEMIFLDMMLKGMRKTVPGDSMFDSEATRTFTSILDQEFSRKLADQGGLGLADLLVKQLSQLHGGHAAKADTAVKKSADLPIKQA